MENLLASAKSFNIYFTQFGTFLCFLMSLGEWIRREKGQRPSFLFFTGLVVGSIQLRIGFMLNGTILENPGWTILLASSIYMAGPLILMMALKMVEFAHNKKTKIAYHFIPAVLALFFDIYFQSIDSATRAAMIREALYEPRVNLINIGLFLGDMHAAAYFLWMIFLNFKLKREYDIRYKKLVTSILITPFLGIIAFGVSTLIYAMWLSHIGAALVTLSIIFIYLFTAKYPNFFVSLKSEIEKKKYESTQLTGLNLDAVRERLEKLMLEEKLFLNENLRLDELADECLVTRHQLSRILNEHYAMNFNEFVNSYRVAEAQRLLIEKPDHSVLSIGYEVGFNTKTTFNSHFLKITGDTPAAYRRKNLPEKD